MIRAMSKLFVYAYHNISLDIIEIQMHLCDSSKALF